MGVKSRQDVSKAWSTIRSVIRRSGIPLGFVLAILTLNQHPAGQMPKHVARLERQDDGDERPLAVGQSIERQLSGDQSHSYLLALHTGDYLHVTIAQQGINVAATLIQPDGRELLSVDACDDDFREETVIVRANDEGTHRLVVRSTPATTPAGRYTIRVDELRPATESDETRIEGERAFERGQTVRAARRPAEYALAVNEFKGALARYKQVADLRGEMKAFIALAFVQFGLSRPEALESAEHAEQIARELGDRAARAAALVEMARALRFRGDRAAALRATEESTAISRAIGNRKVEAWSLNQEGIVYGSTDDAEKAVARFELALPLARAADPGFEATILNNLGIAWVDLGELEKALDVYSRSLAAQRASGQVEGQVVVLNNMGNLQRRLGNNRAALDLHYQALAMAREGGGSRENEARSLNTIGQTYYALGEYGKALEFHRESLTVRREIGDLAGQAASLIGEGKALGRLGDNEHGVAALREGLAIERTIRDQFGERDALQDLAVIESEHGNLTGALEHIKGALDLEETLRARITSPQLRASFVAREQAKYELFIDLLQQQHRADASAGHDAEALGVGERARARVLLESLLDAHVELRQGIDPALLERERALQKQLDDASTQLSRALAAVRSSPQQSKAAADKADELTRAYQELQAEIRRQSPRYAAVTQPQPLTATEIQQTVLDEDTVLLEFALGEQRSWLWAVTSRHVESVELPPRRTIDAAAQSLYAGFIARQLHRAESSDVHARRISAADTQLALEAARMSKMLLGGIATQLNNEWRDKRLAFVPAGALEYLPFAALPIPDRRVPLVARHEIVTIPSASVIAVLRREAAGRKSVLGTLAILADPVFEKSDPRVGTRPSPAARDPVASDAMAPRPIRAGDGFARLPFSREEANGIAVFARPGKVFMATDFQASRDTALGGALSGYQIVHFATHGVLDSERPSLSGLVLSLVDERGAPVNGYLRLHDVYNLRLGADLVVLSACQTALGKEIKGEGLVGLARAFMYAGAPRVVASLWEVSDLATARFMKLFYHGVLQQGLRPAAALQAAQLEMSRDPRWAPPYYWAGFTLQGEWK
jgi:CHAT domain-containing protein/tetratricopeptide (TPR) repeat protein